MDMPPSKSFLQYIEFLQEKVYNKKIGKKVGGNNEKIVNKHYLLNHYF